VTDTAAILAGGFGTRLRQVVADIPKPLAPVGGKPFIGYVLNFLEANGIMNAVISVGHQAEKIIGEIGNSFAGINVDYAHERDPLGTGGGLRLALEKCGTETVLALNGDSIFTIDLKRFFAQHVGSKAKCSVALRRVKDTSRYGTVVVGDNDRITSFAEKTETGSEGLVNGGIYLIDRNWFLSETEHNKPFSLEKDFFTARAGDGTLAGFEHQGYFIDIGIPADFARAQDELKGFAY
jgi:D-glycero-alpha-D-manno-heptose 1-phosphate guanylyltransferase